MLNTDIKKKLIFIVTDFTDPLLSGPEAEARLSVCCFLTGRSNWQQLSDLLPNHRYALIQPQSQSELLHVLERNSLERNSQQIDCLLLQDSPALVGLISWLGEHATLLPTVILTNHAPSEAPEKPFPILYHEAEIRLSMAQLELIPGKLQEAIEAFLQLSPACYIPEPEDLEDFGAEMGGYINSLEDPASAKIQLVTQQQRLSEKLKERLGYLGVYYKRSSQVFLRNLPLEEQTLLLSELKVQYRGIVLGYFTGDQEINQKIDAYVDMAFFADIPVSQVVEIHMEVMDDFVKQLKLEGRSDEIVLDYRLTLIDALAHLCEMYRRSIPTESRQPDTVLS
jgi:circadian clock protein KaiA